MDRTSGVCAKNACKGLRRTLQTALVMRTVVAIALSAWPAFAAGGTVSAQSPEPLPPFRLDPQLPHDLIINPGQGLGQCHWLDSRVLGSPQVSWAYDASLSSAWKTIEPQPGEYSWGTMDALVARAQGLGRRIWLELLTTEGSTPEWAIQAGVTLVGSRGGTPVPWDEGYQQLLRRAVHAMAERYDGDPTVDAVVIMAGGCYGEMSICAAQADRRAWEEAGYSDARFIEAVKRIVGIYLEADYTWENGRHTHGFVHTPIVLQLGAGLYGHTLEIIQPVVDYVISRYGMRVWLKYNGWGGNHDMGWLYEQYAGQTRLGYEPAGNSPTFLENPVAYVQSALEQHTSFLCLQQSYFAVESPAWVEARDMAARHLGAQIVLESASAPETVTPGQDANLRMQWVNRGTVPLMAARRLGEKDVPTSFEISVALAASGAEATAWEQQSAPSVPTTEWYAAQPVTVSVTLALPEGMLSGTYEVRVGLVHPDSQGTGQSFRLIHEGNRDAAGRHTVATLEVRPVEPATSATPAAELQATPTPGEEPQATATGLAGLLQRIWKWVRGLFSGLSYFSRADVGTRSHVLAAGRAQGSESDKGR